MPSEREPLRPTLRHAMAAWAFGKWSRHHSSGIAILRNTLSRHRPLVAGIISANVVASLFEGTSTALLFVAARELVGEVATTQAQTAGWLERGTEFLHEAIGPGGFFAALVFLVVLSQVLRSGLAFTAVSLAARLQMLARKEAYSLVLKHIVGLEFSKIAAYDSGQLFTYVNIAKYLDNLVETTNSIIYTLVISLSYIAILMWISWDVTLAAIALLVPVSLVLRNLILRIQEASRDLLGAQLELNFRTLEFLGGMRLIRTFAKESTALEVLGESIDKSLDATRRGLVYQAAVRPIIEVVTVGLLALILLAGYLFFGEDAGGSLPHILIFVYTMFRLIPRVTSFNNYWAAISRILPNLVYTMEFLAEPYERPQHRDAKPFTGLHQGIEFRDVTLNYVKDERRALSDVSFTIPRGKMVALVGESGAGKSSVIDLLLGLYQPTTGKVVIDGIDLADIDLSSWRRHLGVVSQDMYLLNASIRDNIAFADPGADDGAIINAARQAHAHEFIEELDQGYETTVGERGYRLSGGQCQRLAIARALLHDPEILILDEATSELDSESERLIQEALSSFRRHKTVVAIAHRLSTVTSADQIIVLKNGEIIETGRHEDLLSRQGAYAYLWKLQAGEAV